MPAFFIRWIAACLAAAALGAPAWAAGLSESDAKAVRKTVQAQLAAFAADDARKAFSYAAPAIQQMFGTPDQFMAMVRAQYPMVHRAASASFLKPEPEGDAVLQRVQLTDAAGTPWLATYRMQRHPSGAWRIGGCVVAPAPSRLTT